ncbi:MAG TPA: peptidoglycan-binding domain-containing protein, partial [Thermoanaerobaculia bacterium]
MPLGGDTPGDFQHIGKKKKKKPVLVKGEQHSGGSKVPHGGGGGGGGGGPHPAEGGRGPSEQHGISHGSPGVRRKQRKLRAHGFHIRVDGIWGARSQAAWIAFQEQRRQARQRRAVRRTASSATRSYYRSLRIRSQAMARGLAEQRRRAAAEAERIQSISAVEDVRIGESNRRRREEIHTRAVARALSISRDQGRTALRGYGVTRAHPASAKNLSLHELTRIVSDPSSPWNPQRAQDVRMVQRWLRAHGFERLDVDGVFGPQTFESLVKATERAEARQRRHDVAQVRDRFYKSGIISVGDAIPFL